MAGKANGWDAIVIGSGIGGMAAAAALATHKRRVLVLERHSRAGGLTQTFERDGYHFNVGVHYIGGFGPDGQNRRIFDALAGGRIEMAQIPGAYDRVFFPQFSIAFAPPRSTLINTLKAAFPAEAAGIDRYFDAMNHAVSAIGATFVTHSAPAFVAKPMEWIKGHEIERWVTRTTWDVVRDCVRDSRLQCVLCAQWGDYGTRPSDSSFGMHAMVMQHYLDGGWFPVGGSGSFARELGVTIENAGGKVCIGAEVTEIRVQDRRVQGVTLAGGERVDAPCVISDAGIHNTLRLLPTPEIDYQWAGDALDLEPSIGHIGLFLGLEGDIAAHGADTANFWFYDSWDVNAKWTDPFTQPRAPAMFVSFPSLRDPAHVAGPKQRHTCEIVALVDWNVFAQWDHTFEPGGMHAGTPSAERNETYQAFKTLITQNLMAQFAEHFPALVPMVKLTITSTPISVASVTGAEHGVIYGLETSPQRFLTHALRPRTPIGGLLLAGQDACTPGVTGAMMGGLMAAANVEPRLWTMLR